MYKKTEAIFSIYGKNGIIPWHFFLILSWAFRGRWGRRRPPSEGGRFWGWKFFFTKTKNLAFQLCFPCYGIFPTRNALKLTFVFFHLQLYGYRDSPDSAVFWSPANRTIGKTALIEHWFSTKIAIWDFWVFKVHFFCQFQ